MALFTVTGQTVRSYRPHVRTLAASREVLAAVDQVYFYISLWVYNRAIDPRTFSTAVWEFRLVQHVFDSPSGRKRALLGTLERACARTPFSLVCAMSHRDRAELTSDFDNREHRAWEHPFTHEQSEKDFWGLWGDARSRVAETLRAFFSMGLDLADARELTGDVNFEGAVSAPDAPFNLPMQKVKATSHSPAHNRIIQFILFSFCKTFATSPRFARRAPGSGAKVRNNCRTLFCIRQKRNAPADNLLFATAQNRFFRPGARLTADF